MLFEVLRRLVAEKLGSQVEARILCEIAFGFTAKDILTKAKQEVDETLVSPLLERRLRGEPIQRIMGSTAFYGLDFVLNEATLIPRADSETLVNAALKGMPNNARVLDLGTGTGCIIISILHENKFATGVASDISEKALEAALTNAKENKIYERLTLIHSDWFSKIEGQFNLIVSNPPYIAFDEAKDLVTDVLNHDPHLALFAENNGLAAYEAIFKQARKFLKPHGKILVEIGYQQAESVKELALKNGFVFEKLTPDLANNPRVITFY